MTIEMIPMHLKGWIQRYAHGKTAVRALYDYQPVGQEFERLRELSRYEFQRNQLREALETYHLQFQYNQAALEQINKLHDKNSVVVVGGQQAGLLTGPIYTIAKALTILLKAKSEEARLGVPVLPVFWIAGEDHDWEEVNHVYVHTHEDQIRKIKYNGGIHAGAPVSEQLIDETMFTEWLDRVFGQYVETVHTKEIYEQILAFARRSASVSHFFADMMLWLFREKGLVMIDPQQPAFRKLMAGTWQQLIEHHREVSAAFQKAQQNLEEIGEEPFIVTSEGHTHLFYHYDGRREKLIVHPDGELSLANGQLKRTAAEWSEEAKHSPENFSANVFTRPYVQERLLPVLSFIAGPGEAAYWSMLSPLYHYFGRYVPPVTPRLQQVFVDRTSEKTILAESLTTLDVTLSGTTAYQEDIKSQNKQVDTEGLLEKSLTIAEKAHGVLHEALHSIETNEQSYAYNNYKRLQKVLTDMSDHIDTTQHRRIAPRLQKLRCLEQRLYPNQQPQERVLNIIQILNEYGVERLDSLFSEADYEAFQQQFLYL